MSILDGILDDLERISHVIDIDRRDLFAAFALVGLAKDVLENPAIEVAHVAYELADAMEEARGEK